MKLTPISVGRAIDLMREGKEVYWKSQNNEGYARVVGERGSRKTQIKILSADCWAPVELNFDHQFFEISEPKKLTFEGSAYSFGQDQYMGKTKIALAFVPEVLDLGAFRSVVQCPKVRVTIEELPE